MWAMMWLVVASVIQPVAVAQEVQPTVAVQVEMEVDGSPIAEEFVVRLENHETVTLRLRVLETAEADEPVDPPDPSVLLEIRPSSGEVSPVRFNDWDRVGIGVYETTFTPTQRGELEIVVLPEIEDRSSLAPESTDRVSLIVEDGSDSAQTGSEMTGIIVVLTLFVIVGSWVVVNTRRKARVPKKPFPHDTWWNSP